MANDFITLACPTCGGKLNFSPNTTSLICQNCGNEHLVRHNAANITLELHACCPECKLNDMSQKVSAAYLSLSSPKQLAPPIKPKPKSIGAAWFFAPILVPGFAFTIFLSPINKKSKLVIGSIAAFIIIGAYITEDLHLQHVDSLGLGYGVLYNLLLIPSVFIMLTVLIVYYVELYREYQRRVAEFQKQTPIWEKAMREWNVLYYCSRDDCVFFPQTNIHVSVNKIDELLYNQK